MRKIYIEESTPHVVLSYVQLTRAKTTCAYIGESTYNVDFSYLERYVVLALINISIYSVCQRHSSYCFAGFSTYIFPLCVICYAIIYTIEVDIDGATAHSTYIHKFPMCL